MMSHVFKPSSAPNPPVITIARLASSAVKSPDIRPAFAHVREWEKGMIESD